MVLKFAAWHSSFIVRQPHNSDYHNRYHRKTWRTYTESVYLHYLLLERLVSFPGPAQLSVASSTEKRKRVWNILSREWRRGREKGRQDLIERRQIDDTRGPSRKKSHTPSAEIQTEIKKSTVKSRNPEIQAEIQKSTVKSRNPLWNPEIQSEIQKSTLKSRNPLWNPEIHSKIRKSNLGFY